MTQGKSSAAELMVICREVDRETGRITVYAIEATVTDVLMKKLSIHARVNPELRYFVTLKCR